MLRAKIHRATVTDACLEYEGSLTIDPELLDAAGILPYEFVMVSNLNNGERFSTYNLRSGLANPKLRSLFREKLPLFALSVAFSAIAIVAQSAAIQSSEAVPLLDRLAQVPLAYLRYLWMLAWPLGLHILYPPLDEAWLQSTAAVGGSALALLAVTGGALALGRSIQSLT